MTRLGKELESFKSLWKGGYYEGDPFDPLCRFPSYGTLNWISSHHATYLRCIKPYIRHDTVALEIGPGRGCWTKALLPAREIYVLDALSAEHNGFFEYVGHHSHVKYFQVDDFSCSMLPDSHFDYMFSFGCLCHVSLEGITAYAQNLFGKLKPGANCFWMIADYAHFNASGKLAHENHQRLVDHLLPYSRFWYFIRSLIAKHNAKHEKIAISPDINHAPSPGRWYDCDKDKVAHILESLGYQVLDKDVGTNLRDPILHFIKP